MERTEPIPEGHSLEELAQKVGQLRPDFAAGRSSARKRVVAVDGPTAPDRALMNAVTWNDVSSATLLIECAALPDGVRDDKWILANALMFRKADTAALLVANGASRDRAMAAGVGRMDLVESKFDAHGAIQAGEKLFSGWWDGSPASGLDLTETRFVLNFAFAVACAWHHFGIADFLLDRGACVDGGAQGFLDEDFSTVLHMAAFFGDKELVGFLLARGADPSLPDKIHQATACGHAEAAGHEAIAARLRDAAARIGQSS